MGDLAPSGRQQKSEEMRKRLLDAAYSIYAAEGSVGLTNRKIAIQADTTTQAIYTYFGSRDALVDEMYTSAVRSVDAIFTEAVATASSDRSQRTILEIFTMVARTYRQFCLDNPAQFRMLLTSGSDPRDPTDVVGLSDRLIDEITSFGRSGGDWTDPFYGARVRLTLAAMHGFIMAELAGNIGPDHDPDRLYGELIQRLLVPFDDLAGLWPATESEPDEGR